MTEVEGHVAIRMCYWTASLSASQAKEACNMITAAVGSIVESDESLLVEQVDLGLSKNTDGFYL